MRPATTPDDDFAQFAGLHGVAVDIYSKSRSDSPEFCGTLLPMIRYYYRHILSLPITPGPYRTKYPDPLRSTSEQWGSMVRCYGSRKSRKTNLATSVVYQNQIRVHDITYHYRPNSARGCARPIFYRTPQNLSRGEQISVQTHQFSTSD